MTPFAKNIRARAEALALSNAEVARRAGLPERRYGNYATGRREPDLATLVKIATVLGVSVDALLDNDEAGRKSTAADLLKERLAAAVVAMAKADLESLVASAEAVVKLRSQRR